MRKRAIPFLFLCLAAVCPAPPASGSPIRITFGREIHKLQDLVDRRYGRNHIDVTKDFIGARAADIDPWFWVGGRFGAVYVRVLRRNDNLTGWYLDSDDRAVMPSGSGVLFSGPVRPREEAVVTLPGFRTRFGFYVNAPLTPEGPTLSSAPSVGTGGERFFTNRKLNDCGPTGTGAIHEPFDGDVQALVFDVSPWAGPDTWLVCFEDQDTGGSAFEDEDRGNNGNAYGRPWDEDDPDGDGRERGPGGSNNDFYDVVFEVKADGATPAHGLTFGRLKLLYR